MDAGQVRNVLRRGAVLDMLLLELESTVVREALILAQADVDPRGLRIVNACMTGELDLSGMLFPFPVRFENCSFDSALNLEGASVGELALIDCPTVPGLKANGLTVSRDLTLSGSRIAGSCNTAGSTSKRASVWLCEADIGGKFLCVGTIIDPGEGRAIHADRLHVGGTIRLLDKFIARGEIRIIGAHVDGSIDMTSVWIHSAGRALDLAETVIGGSVFIANLAGQRPSHIRGVIDMGNAHIMGELLLRNAVLEENATARRSEAYVSDRRRGTAVNAPKLTVGGDVGFEGDCLITGGMDFSGASFGHVSIDSACVLAAGYRTALDLTRAELHADLVLEHGVRVAGTIRITGAKIGGNLRLQDVHLSRPEGKSLLAAQAVHVGGDVELQGLIATGGQVRFRSAVLNSVFDAGGSILSNSSGTTLSLYQAVVRGSVQLDGGFSSVGQVVLNRCQVDGRLDCSSGRFSCPEISVINPNGNAIEAVSSVIYGGLYLGWKEVSPSVDFGSCTTTILADDPGRWPQRFSISGLTYDRFEQIGGLPARSAWDTRQRLAWLGRQTAFDGGSYEQVARVYRQHGFQADAEAILIEQRTQARRRPHQVGSGQVVGSSGVRSLRKVREALFGITVAYGFRPGRVLWAIVALLLAVFITLQGASGLLRATDPRGNVYTPNGRLVTVVDGPSIGSAADAVIGTDGHRGDFAAVTSQAAKSDNCGSGQVRCFDSVFFSIDTVIPLISFGQRDTWYPDTQAIGGGFLEMWLNLATLVGWLLSSVFVLSFTRFARNV